MESCMQWIARGMMTRDPELSWTRALLIARSTYWELFNWVWKMMSLCDRSAVKELSEAREELMEGWRADDVDTATRVLFYWAHGTSFWLLANIVKKRGTLPEEVVTSLMDSGGLSNQVFDSYLEMMESVDEWGVLVLD